MSICGLRSLNHCWITRPSGKRGLIERNAAIGVRLAVRRLRRHKTCVIHALEREQMALAIHDRNRDGHAHLFGLFNHRLDKLAAFDRAQFCHDEVPHCRMRKFMQYKSAPATGKSAMMRSINASFVAGAFLYAAIASGANVLSGQAGANHHRLSARERSRHRRTCSPPRK
jgi:hypothetical protein